MIQSSSTLEQKLSEFSDSQLKIIANNVGAIQLTSGCSISCHFCGLGANDNNPNKTGAHDYINYDYITNFVSSHKRQISNAEPTFYFASEPFDYDFDGHDYFDIISFIKKTCNYTPFTATAIPKGKENAIFDSIFDPNKKRIKSTKLSNTDLKYYTNELVKIISGIKPDGLKKFIQENFDDSKNSLSRYEKCMFLPRAKRRNQQIVSPHSIKELSDSLNRSVRSNKKWTKWLEWDKEWDKNPALKFYERKLKSKIAYAICNVDSADYWTENIIDRISIIDTNIARIRNKINIYLKEKSVFGSGIYNVQVNHDHLPLSCFDVNPYTIGKGYFLREGAVRDIYRKNGLSTDFLGLYRLGDLENKESHQQKSMKIYYSILPNNKLIAKLRPLTIKDIFVNTDLLENARTKKLGRKNINNLDKEGICNYNGVLLTPKGVFNLKTITPNKVNPHGIELLPINPRNFEVARLRRQYNPLKPMSYNLIS